MTTTQIVICCLILWLFSTFINWGIVFLKIKYLDDKSSTVDRETSKSMFIVSPFLGPLFTITFISFVLICSPACIPDFIFNKLFNNKGR